MLVQLRYSEPCPHNPFLPGMPSLSTLGNTPASRLSSSVATSSMLTLLSGSLGSYHIPLLTVALGTFWFNSFSLHLCLLSQSLIACPRL